MGVRNDVVGGNRLIPKIPQIPILTEKLITTSLHKFTMILFNASKQAFPPKIGGTCPAGFREIEEGIIERTIGLNVPTLNHVLNAERPVRHYRAEPCNEIEV